MLTDTQIKKSNLFKQIQDGLVEDFQQYSTTPPIDYNDWMLRILQDPPERIEKLLQQIPERSADIWFELIDQELQILVHKIQNSS